MVRRAGHRAETSEGRVRLNGLISGMGCGILGVTRDDEGYGGEVSCHQVHGLVEARRAVFVSPVHAGRACGACGPRAKMRMRSQDSGDLVRAGEPAASRNHSWAVMTASTGSS